MSTIPPNLPNFNSESISSNWKTSVNAGCKQQIRVVAKKEGYEVELLTYKASSRIGSFFKEAISKNEQEPQIVLEKRSFSSFEDFDTFCDATISRQEKVKLYRELRNKIKSTSTHSSSLDANIASIDLVKND